MKKQSLLNVFLFVTVLFIETACAKTVYLEKEKIVEVKEYVTHTDSIIIPKIQRDTIEVVAEIQDTSRLSTRYATSEAFVIRGELHHSIWNLPEAFHFNIDIPTLHRDSIIRIREPYPVEVIKEVRKVPGIYKACLWIVIGEVLLLLGIGVLRFRKIL